jgi:hypothetical protein
MKIINYGFLRFKLLECRIDSIDQRIEELQNLSLFYQKKFDKDRSDNINKKIEYLSKRRTELMAIFQYGS